MHEHDLTISKPSMTPHPNEGTKAPSTLTLTDENEAGVQDLLLVEEGPLN